MSRYTEAWTEHQSLRKGFLLCWLGGPVVFVVLSSVVSVLGAFLSPSTQKAMLDGVFFLGAVGWVLATLGTGAKLFFGFRCPRCGNLFYVKGLMGNAFSGHCLHCRLRRGAQEPPAEELSGQR